MDPKRYTADELANLRAALAHLRDAQFLIGEVPGSARARHSHIISFNGVCDAIDSLELIFDECEKLNSKRILLTQWKSILPPSAIAAKSPRNCFPGLTSENRT